MIDPRSNDLNLWINWSLNAVLGRMHEADFLLRAHLDEIRRVADEMMRRRPVEVGALYRGVLLDPAKPYPSPTFDDLPSVSWTEDRDVARWFACTESVISAYAKAQWPAARGHLLEIPAPSTRVLFHWRWAGGLAPYALAHPMMGIDGFHQITWSLRTQREVITERVADLVPVPIEVDDVRELDARFAPPWYRSAS